MDGIWNEMVLAAKTSLEQQGYKLEKIPGRGRSNVWFARKDGSEIKVCIRTSQDRWFAFPAMEKGWKTLEDVDRVVVAAVNDRENPTTIEVYHFDKNVVEDRFDRNRAARLKAGQNVRIGYGMWIAIDRDDRGLPASEGAGLGEDFPPVFTTPITMPSEDEAGDWAANSENDPSVDASSEPNVNSIKGAMDQARATIAKIAGVDVANVKLELKIDY